MREKPGISTPIMALAALLLVTFLVYYRGLTGEFLFDDYYNIVNNDRVHLTQLDLASLQSLLGSGVATSMGRPLAMLSFGIDHYLHGLNPWHFKLVNVLIHLVCGVLVYLLTREVCAARVEGSSGTGRLWQLPLLVAGGWLLLPLNVSTTLFVVQRMTQLSALFTLLALLGYFRFRRSKDRTSGQGLVAFAAFCLFTMLGILSKENAALVVLFVLAAEYFLLGFRADSPGQRWFLRCVLVLLVALPALLLFLALAVRPTAIVGDYSVRDFTLVERLLSEPRALWHYVKWILLPDTRALSFYHDDFPHSRGVLSPPATLLALLAWALVLIWVHRYRRTLPVAAFGMAFFLAGHLLESSIINLELIFEHRNYLPSFGLLLAAFHTLLSVPAQFLQQNTRAFLAGCYLLFLGHGTWEETGKWSNTFEHLVFMSNVNPDSHRVNYSMGHHLLGVAALNQDDPAILEAASDYMERAIPQDSRAVRAHIGYLMAESRLGRTPASAVVDDLVNRLETGNLMLNGFRDVSQLTDCWYAGTCTFDKGILARSYSAIARNQARSPIERQAILEQIGSAILRVFRSPQDARALFYLARSLRPELTIIDINLVQLELSQGDRVAAGKLLREAQSRPGSRDIRRELELLEKSLSPE